MKNYNPMKNYKQWLVVCNSKHMHDPSLATPLCVVDTITRDDGLMFHLFLKQTNMVAYDLKIYAKHFAGRYASCDFLSFDEYKATYPVGKTVTN